MFYTIVDSDSLGIANITPSHSLISIPSSKIETDNNNLHTLISIILF